MQLVTPPPLYGWAQPTVAADWTADLLEQLHGDDTLEGGGVVPGFLVPLNQLW